MIDNTYTLAPHTHEIYINQHTLSAFSLRPGLVGGVDGGSDDVHVPPLDDLHDVPGSPRPAGNDASTASARPQIEAPWLAPR